MKKIIALLLAMVMVLSLGACGKQKPTNAGSFDDDVQYTFSDTVTSTTSDESPSSKVENSSKSETGSSSSALETNTSNTSSTPIINIPTVEDNRTIIACWGDSITEGMHMHDKSYPTRLQEMLGDNFKVYNGGDGGEKTRTIAARQGGIKVYTSKKITFSRGSDKTAISTESSAVFATENGSTIELTELLGNGINVSPVKIGGVEYQLKFDYFNWSPRTFKLYLYRSDDIDKLFTIPEGTEVVFGGTDISTKGGVDIYMMGANGGYANDAEYIEQIKAMIKHHGSDKYLIIKPYWDDISGLETEFSGHVVDFPKLAVENGLAFEGLTPTEADKLACSKNKIPPSLRYQNEADNVHLNEYGYHFLANCIYEKGKTLGYW